MPMLALVFFLFFFYIMKDTEGPSDLLPRRMASLEITNYSALFGDTDEQQQDIWADGDQPDEKRYYLLCHSMLLLASMSSVQNR